MKTVAGAILVLAGAVLMHSAAVGSRGYGEFTMLCGVGVGIFGIVVVAMNLGPRGND